MKEVIGVGFTLGDNVYSFILACVNISKDYYVPLAYVCGGGAEYLEAPLS